IVTCSPEKIPEPLVDQLKEGGQMIIPVGQRYQQNLFRVTKRSGKLERETLRATLFVPMTGTAEAERQVLPNPRHPVIENGHFDRVVGDSRLPANWHYLRQARVVAEDAAYLSMTNRVPGQACRALQGLALDGQAISEVQLSVRLRGRDLATGPTPHQRAAVIITFYDQRRAVIGSSRLGPWKGSFDWKIESKRVRVPFATREAIVRLGLHGGVGQLDLDDVAIGVVGTK
ncbi:MAG: protein-L-isoaspartate(D-aspartate) O-methyltransferase, partial [Pirellulales bacterium]|nr:protein-L-isoaspartate(D-aspartate) O-methyltransferase [Pirellulales bacterium]